MSYRSTFMDDLDMLKDDIETIKEELENILDLDDKEDIKIAISGVIQSVNTLIGELE